MVNVDQMRNILICHTDFWLQSLLYSCTCPSVEYADKRVQTLNIIYFIFRPVCYIQIIGNRHIYIYNK